MTTDYYFACKQCKKAIHVGQTGFSGVDLYKAYPDLDEKLKQFLFYDHSYHDLQFVQDQDPLIESCDRIEWNDKIMYK